jgi:uncharacterized protein (DUF427 family)
MPSAHWNGATLAASDHCEVVENNYYFPPSSIRREFLEESETHTTCPWKGQASYFDIVVNGKRNEDAAWFYPEPKPAAKNIKGYVAFWKGVSVTP